MKEIKDSFETIPQTVVRKAYCTVLLPALKQKQEQDHPAKGSVESMCEKRLH